jgi:hypothetical protein
MTDQRRQRALGLLIPPKRHRSDTFRLQEPADERGTATMGSDDRHIFHDPTGRRDRRMRLILGITLSALAAIVAAFLATLAFAPRLPSVTLKDPHVLSSLHKETAHRLKPNLDWRKVPRPTADDGLGPGAADQRRLLCQLGRGLPRVPAPQHRQAGRGLAAVGGAEGRGRRHRPGRRPAGRGPDRRRPNHPAVLPLVHNSANAAFNGPLATPCWPIPRRGPSWSPAWPTWRSSAATAAMSSTWRTCRPRAWRTIPSCWTRPGRC